MDARKQRGIEIAAKYRITRKGAAWIVPSQSGDGSKYTVVPDSEAPHCSCPDHETHRGKCKHLYAVEIVQQRELFPDGTEEITQSVTVTETLRRKTYQQDWPAYNAAQTNEKDEFQALLHELCQGVEDHRQRSKKGGRPPLPLADALFAVCFKIYSTVSGRRFMSDLRDAKAKGHISHVPHFNSIFNYLDDPKLTPTLHQLILKSALPLKSLESSFAVDSSAFSSSRFDRWFDEKWGTPRRQHHWIKAQVMCGVKTNVVTSATICDRDGADSPYMPALVRETAKHFAIEEVSADKGYSTVENHNVVAECGATPFIAFKIVATGMSGGLWQKMFHYFSYRREEFLTHYHQRSNVETVFSMVKAKFQDHLRSKSDQGMKNEVLCKLICHNICCLIQSMHEFGIEPGLLATNSDQVVGLSRRS